MIKKVPDNNKIDINELIFQYKWWIGSFLLVAVLASGGYLLWRENWKNDKTGMSSNDQIAQLSERIQNTELRIQQLEINASKTSSNEVAKQLNSDNTGQVAGASTSNTTAPSGTAALAGKVNLNTGTVADLDTLPGIGAAYAQRIIDYRTTSGGFKDISELKNIKGIGDKTYEKLKDLVTI